MSTADKLTQIAENVPKVFAAGEKAEYDRFWDALQSDPNSAFMHWPDEAFYPKNPIVPTTMQRMFLESNIVNLRQRLIDCGVYLDTSNVKDFSYTFYTCYYLKELPVIDISKINNSTGLFGYCSSLKTIEKLILYSNHSLHNTCFVGVKNIENIVFEGRYPGSSINLQECTKLTHDSLMSLINVLEDFSTDTSGKVRTVTIGATNRAKLTAEEIAIAENKGWTVA